MSGNGDLQHLKECLNVEGYDFHPNTRTQVLDQGFQEWLVEINGVPADTRFSTSVHLNFGTPHKNKRNTPDWVIYFGILMGFPVFILKYAMCCQITS